MVFPIPPLVIRVPAPFPLGIQVSPSFIRQMAVFALVMNCAVESSLSLFDCVLAAFSFIRMCKRRDCE
jgi:hypothetical protein